MGIPRAALLVVGVLAILIGLIWIGQGTGYFPLGREQAYAMPDDSNSLAYTLV